MISETTLETDNPEKLSVLPDTEYEDKEIRSVITKKDLWKVGFRGLFMEGNFNYERMQAGGFCFSIIPA
ncbi:PTS system mannose/fructose/sorbose family transporter subunit IID, partial [Salmonella enterica subsp. enterica serovar Durban]|nr:PTS system mannose/fructose/sorbose family transporter subunit IID [Salmonella enterica subsp. enterica serovar Durban]